MCYEVRTVNENFWTGGTEVDFPREPPPGGLLCRDWQLQPVSMSERNGGSLLVLLFWLYIVFIATNITIATNYGPPLKKAGAQYPEY